MLLRDLIKNLSNPAPDVDPEDRAFGGEGAKLAAEDESLYEGSEALTRRSKLRPLDDMGASYRGSVVSRADMGEEVSEDGESADESADESAGESDAEPSRPGGAAAGGQRRGVRFSVDPPQVRRFIKGSTVSPQPKLRSPAAGGGADAASSSSSGNDAEEDSDSAVDENDIGAILEREQARLKSDEKAFEIEQRRDTRERARAVRAQHRLWEGTLKTRIRLQGPLTLASRLPRPRARKRFRAARPELKSAYKRATARTLRTLRSLMATQQRLLSRSGVFATPANPPPARDGSKGLRAQVADLWAHANAGFEATKSSALRVMEEWSAKTRLASGAGLARGGGARRFKALDQSVTSQVEGLLVDMPNLVRRTQLRRSGGRALGDIPGDNDASDEVNGKKNGLILNGKEAVYDPEVFDDADFYQQLLREVISGDSAMGSLSSVQRAAKKPRKMRDRRASKGRKIRYVNIPKLTNFTTPREVTHDEYPRDSLFASLFGQVGGGGLESPVTSEAAGEEAATAAATAAATNATDAAATDQDDDVPLDIPLI